jgi:hypothetical protein
MPSIHYSNEHIINHGIAHGINLWAIPFKSKEMKKSDQTRGASVGMYYLYTMIVVVILAALVSSCGTSKHGGCNYQKAQKYNQRQQRKAARYYRSENSINNPENREYVEEIAFNEGIQTSEVTQQMFDARYN